jgi:hypothetical protein
MPRLTAIIEAKQVLDELWSEKLIPFALSVGKIEETPGEYTIYFHDSRMHSVCIPIIEGDSFKDTVRSAVLARVSEISGPFKKPPLT